MHTISRSIAEPKLLHQDNHSLVDDLMADSRRSPSSPALDLAPAEQGFLQQIRQRQPSQTSLRVVALGDSLIYGYGDPVGGGWVEQLRRQWMHPHSPGHVLYNLGIRGDGVHQVSQRLDAEFHCRGELRHRVPDVILLSVGINDSARLGRPTGKLFTPMPKFEQDLAYLLDHAQGLCPVLFVGMTPVDENRMPFMGCMYYNHADQWAYKETTQKACAQRGIPYLDIFDRWMNRGEAWWRSRLCADGLHPNPEGYQALLADVQTWSVFQAFM
ncbi:MAG: GDSL-type esterase/lipase family protein [Leptolyngbyaceae bacterium]|nr:GDSL-type esterase/lipase family protein [Leptolyngbyaceae bacterium]